MTHLIIALAIHHHHYPHITPLPPPNMDGGGGQAPSGGYGIAFALVGLALFVRYLAKRNGE